MPWKPEYAEARRQKRAASPPPRAVRTPEAKAKAKAYMEQYRANNLEKWQRTPEQQAKVNAARRAKYAGDPEHRERAKSAAAIWQSGNPEKRKSQRLAQYGITVAEYNALLENQGASCAICGFSDMSNPSRFPLVDHCHTTGKVRGLLCTNCNFGIGSLGDDPERLRKAADYLSRS